MTRRFMGPVLTALVTAALALGPAAPSVGATAAAPATASATATAEYVVVYKDGAVKVVKATVDQARRLASDPNVVGVELNHKVALDPRENPKSRVSAQRVIPTPPFSAWGLDRTDQRALPLSGSFDPIADGAGVTVYNIDTGVRVDHEQFGGRASIGPDFVGDGWNGVDCNGHGTHTAGTEIGKDYGMAPKAKLVSLRVLGCDGSGTDAGVDAAMIWVLKNARLPAVVNMSIGGDLSATETKIIADLAKKGVTTVAAAGNEDVDACTGSPASAPAAITVGATGSWEDPGVITDRRAAFSNWGKCVDLFAPGTWILSASIDSKTGRLAESGTSMAAPHVTGAVALYLSKAPKATVAQVTNYLLGLSTKNVVTDPKGSPNKLLYVGGPTVSTLKVSPTPITGAAATVKERLKSTSATYFTGSVKMAADNSPVAGSVLVQYEAAGTTKFQTVATVKLAANGSFAGSVSQTKPGQWRAFYTGDGGLIGQSLGYSATPSSPIR